MLFLCKYVSLIGLSVSVIFCKYLSRELGDEWQDLARKLNTPEGQLHTLREDNKGDMKEVKFQILLNWIQREGQQATPGVLAEALSKAGRRDLSEKVLKGHFLTIYIISVCSFNDYAKSSLKL